MGLQQFERRLERLVEGAFAKAFRSGLAPVEVARRITREMDFNRMVGVRGVIVPNHFTVTLSADDFARFRSLPQTLTSELEAMARAHAKDEEYRLVGPVEVEIEEAPRLGRGEFHVTGELREGEIPGMRGVLAYDEDNTLDLGAEPVTIGRLPECEIVLTDSTVSKRHAEIRREGPDYVLFDLESRNGTWVNGNRVSEHVLADGDQIVVGTTRLRFETR